MEFTEKEKHNFVVECLLCVVLMHTRCNKMDFKSENIDDNVIVIVGSGPEFKILLNKEAIHMISKLSETQIVKFSESELMEYFEPDITATIKFNDGERIVDLYSYNYDPNRSPAKIMQDYNEYCRLHNKYMHHQYLSFVSNEKYPKIICY